MRDEICEYSFENALSMLMVAIVEFPSRDGGFLRLEAQLHDGGLLWYPP